MPPIEFGPPLDRFFVTRRRSPTGIVGLRLVGSGQIKRAGTKYAVQLPVPVLNDAAAEIEIEFWMALSMPVLN